MPDIKTSVLIVEDEESVRTSLLQVFDVLGYRARSAADGLAALVEIRQEVPNILLSDLNMPVMSGFELLSVIRRRFPSIHVIAMSGVFFGNQIPCGVTADGFYQKGSGIAALIKVLEGRFSQNVEGRNSPQPIWIQRNGHDASGVDFVTITCPECFRTFPQTLIGAASLILDTICVFCQSSILYGIVDPHGLVFPEPWQPASKPARSAVPLHWAPVGQMPNSHGTD